MYDYSANVNPETGIDVQISVKELISLLNYKVETLKKLHSTVPALDVEINDIEEHIDILSIYDNVSSVNRMVARKKNSSAFNFIA